MPLSEDWRRKPTAYHLSTIGIHEVFTSKSLPTENRSDDANETQALEITGSIKVNPEDFIVREIGGKTRAEVLQGTAATLTDSNSLPKNDEVEISMEGNLEDTPICKTQDKLDVGMHVINASSPKEAVKLILTKACTQDGTDLFEKLKILSDEAALNLNDGSSSTEENCLIIPPIADEVIIALDGTDFSCMSKGMRNRTIFHRTLKLAFPLLKSSTLNAEESSHEANKIIKTKGHREYSDDSGEKLRYLKVEKDSTFKDLVPFLFKPERDIPSLYRFRNDGCTVFSQGRKLNGKKRKHESEPDSIITDDSKITNDEKGQILLYLKPTINRNDRKEIHHLIAKCYRDFETGTKNGVHYDEGGEDRHGEDRTTSAITVKWSRRAQNAALKKKNSDKTKGRKNHTMCIVKKRCQEHLSLINHLAAGLKCRQSDIGLAGIKDTRAVTYQFCTVRNISPFRVMKANEYLKQRDIELGNFQRVSFLLNQGDLKGNQFEIIVRDINRVETKIDGNGIEYERLIPCERGHLTAIVDRVRQNGFVNFFGEQRIGEAGPEIEVGTRSSDIGRLMLRKEFSGAIDLLMKGRNKRRGGDFIESEDLRKMRDIYVSSNGDVDLTLSAFPRGNGLARERTVLQGLKRYGQDKPLDALKCLNFNVRMFWINAYQSLLWNKMASKRLLLLGTGPAIGDLYMDSDSTDIKVVSKANLSDVGLCQVVLPLPGYNVRYPDNTIGDLYAQALEEDGIKFVQDAVPEATAKGSYRRLIVPCDDLVWEEFVSEQATAQILTSDEVNGATFRFSLPSGAYATMCLREIMASTIARA